MEPLLRIFLYVAVFWNDFTFGGKPLIFLTRLRHIIWVVALLVTSDVTNNGRHLGRHLGFYQELEIRLKLREIVFVLYMINYKISTLHDFSHKVYFYCWRKLKKIYFHAKMAWPPATHDFVSRNDRKWPSLNLSQNLREGLTNSYWKRQVLVFHPLGKKLRKTLGRWHPPTSRPPPPLPPPPPCT